jgi:putative salt-induced outer membrane protein
VPRAVSRRESRRSLTAAGRTTRFALIGAALLVTRLPAHAQPTPTEAIRPVAPPAAPVKATTAFVADLGFLNTTGNTEVTTISASEKITHSQGLWRFDEQVNTVYGQNGGKENTNLLRATLGAEYALRSNVGLATGVLYDRNRFAGIAQRTEEYLGFLFKVIQVKEDSLRIETGGSLTQQKGTDGTSDNFPAARGAVWYKHAFTAAAFFLQTVEAIPNLKTSTDWRLNTESAVVAPLSKKLALKAGYVVRYDNLPEPGFKKTDRFLTTGLQLSF